MSDDAIERILKNMQGYIDDDEIQNKVRKEAAQQLRSYVLEAIGPDESTHPDWCCTYGHASERVVCSCGLYSRNELKAEQRRKLK